MRYLIALVLALFVTAVFAQEFGEEVRLSGQLGDDIYTAGGNVYSSATINGDLVASGGQIDINGDIAADAMIAGGNISLKANVGDDARIAGGQINIDAEIGDDLLVAGGQITVSNGSTIHGQAMISGGLLDIAGNIDHDLYAAGGEVIISGHIKGNVQVTSEQLTIRETAVIDGNLSYSSPNEFKRYEGATIHGSISYKPTEWEEYEGHGIFPLVLLAISALFIFFVFPRFSHATSGTIAQQFWPSIGMGVVMFLVVPFLAIFSMAIVVGLWIGLALLALYPVLLLLGSVQGIICSGEYLARLVKMDIAKTSLRIVSILVTVVLLGLLQQVPILGGLTTFVILLVGMGGSTIMFYRKYRGTNTT
jgi:cytoskeletal protein CcmA (bactofilin family)